MKTSAGLWIDHREAVIVILSDSGQATTHIKSKAEKQLRRTGEPAEGSFPAREVPADDSREREYQGELARYYDEVIGQLRAADEILIFGPGEAKGELKKRMEKNAFHARVLMLETNDKMTESQIVARVRQHFHSLVPRIKVGRQDTHTLHHA